MQPLGRLDLGRRKAEVVGHHGLRLTGQQPMHHVLDPDAQPGDDRLAEPAPRVDDQPLLPTGWPETLGVVVGCPVHPGAGLAHRPALVEDDLAPPRHVEQRHQLVLVLFSEVPEEELGPIGEQVAAGQGMLDLELRTR